MAYITYKYKTAECPAWGEEIQIRGQYLYLEDDLHTAKFQMATCPVRENLHLPKNKKNLDYKLFPLCNIEDCPLLKDFPEILKE